MKITEDTTSIILSILGSLTGVIIGGLITFLTMQSIENKKWRRERQEKLEMIKREALAASLEWIEPMRNAHIKASSLVFALIEGTISQENYLQDFPYLIGILAKKDLSGNHRAVLPDFYDTGHLIVKKMEELKFLGIKNSKRGNEEEQPSIIFQECHNKVVEIEEEIFSLEKKMKDAYIKTFNT